MGKFNNKIEAEFDPPRKWILSRALTYTNVDIDEDALERVGVKVIGSRITVKKDFVTDLASVPRMCWAFIARWDVARAAIIHALLYKRIRQYRKAHSTGLKSSEDPKVIDAAKKASDDVFHMAMKDAEPSVAKWKIAAAYYSVRMFGKWSIIPREDDQMATKTSGFVKKDATEKKTCIGGNYGMIKTSSMNKYKRRNYKKYRGQGR